jgi:hypothetical protein
MTVKITPEQLATIARACATAKDLKAVHIKQADHGFDRIDYQLHYCNGTFGSHVVIRREGTIVEPTLEPRGALRYVPKPTTPGEFVDGLIAGGTTNIDTSR